MRSRAEPSLPKRSAASHALPRTFGVADAGLHQLYSAGDPLPARKPGANPKGLFTYLNESEKTTFLAHCSERHAPHDAMIFSQGQKHTTFLIRDGLVRTFYVSPSGKEITLAYWSDGDMIGGPYFFDDQQKNIWSAQAVEDSTLLAIDGARLQKLAMRMPPLALFLIEALSFKLHWVSLVLQTLGTEFVHSRLATLLVRLSELYGEPCDGAILIRYNFTQGDLGAMVGATRQWVSTTLGTLQHDGIVRLHKRRLYILDLDRLKAQTSST